MVDAGRRLFLYIGFGRYLLREFRWPLTTSVVLVVGGGALLKATYHKTALTYVQACHAVFMMLFAQPMLELPAEWYLQPMFFVIPLVGLGVIADSLVRLGFLLFTRKQKLQEWQIMKASLMHQHIIIVGAGKVGYRIVTELLAMKQEVVVVDRLEDSPLITELRDLGVTVIRGDGRLRGTLERAGLGSARAVILTTSDDLANLDAALTARLIRTDVPVVVRLFDDTLAEKVATAFKIPAISSSATAAPAFIAAAIGRAVYHSFQIAGRTLHVTDLAIMPGSKLAGQNVDTLQRDLGVNILRAGGNGAAEATTGARQEALQPGETVLIIGPLEKIATLERENSTAAPDS